MRRFKVFFLTDLMLLLCVLPGLSEEMPMPIDMPIVEDVLLIVESTPEPVTYQEIGIGEKGEAVKKLQERLIRLDYLLDENVDGKYGTMCACAVHDFKEANGIEDAEPHKSENCVATPEMQELLFSDDAKPYRDPEFPLVLYTDKGIDKKDKGDKLTFAPAVLNKSRSRLIKSFTLKCVAEDIWGNSVLDERVTTEWTTDKDVPPGKIAQAKAITLPNRRMIANLRIAVTSITFADSGTMEAAEPVYVALAPVEW